MSFRRTAKEKQKKKQNREKKTKSQQTAGNKTVQVQNGRVKLSETKLN